MLKNKTILITALWLALGYAGNLLAAPQYVYDSGKRRDPFIPLTGEEDASGSSSVVGSVKLEGIIYDPGERSVAILNGNTYRVGESIGETKIVKILKDHVVISIEGEEKELWIREEEKA
jgi:hypothetical protein